jgi:hypothetical protein
VEQGEADRLLHLGVAVDLDVRPRPELVEEPALVVDEALEPGALGRAQRGVDLRAQGRRRALPGPAVRDVLHEPQPAARLDPRGDGHAGEVVLDGHARREVVGALELVLHPGGHAQPGHARVVDEHGAQVVAHGEVGHQRRGERGGGTRVVAPLGGLLVGQQLGLQDAPHVPRRAARRRTRSRRSRAGVNDTSRRAVTRIRRPVGEVHSVHRSSTPVRKSRWRTCFVAVP